MLETRDLLLRQGTMEDAPALFHNLWSRGETFRYMFRKPLDTEEAALARTAAYVGMHELCPTEYFIIEKASGQAIGIAGLKELATGRWTVTDIAIGPDFQGRGYGRQILQALTALAFDRHDARALLYTCFAENTASKNLARSCGFVLDHAQQAELQKDGRDILLECYRLTRDQNSCHLDTAEV